MRNEEMRNFTNYLLTFAALLIFHEMYTKHISWNVHIFYLFLFSYLIPVKHQEKYNNFRKVFYSSKY